MMLRNLLFLPIYFFITTIACASSVKAESYWLIFWSGEKVEKIEMKNMAQCNKEAKVLKKNRVRIRLLEGQIKNV